MNAPMQGPLVLLGVTDPDVRTQLGLGLDDTISFSPTLVGLARARLALAKKRRTRRGARSIAIISSLHPRTAMAASASGIDRVAIYHSSAAHPRHTHAAMLRAAFALCDRVIVPGARSRHEAVAMGADPSRTTFASGCIVNEITTDPRGTHRVVGAAECAVSLALDAAEGLGVLRAIEWVSPQRSGVNIINYHRVLPIEELCSYGRPQMAVAESLFEAQVQTIGRHYGFTRIEDARDASAAGKIAFTFDDGYEDNYRVAAPILHRFGAPACVFLVTDLIGRPNALWWDRVSHALFAYYKGGCLGRIPFGLPTRTRALKHARTFEEARDIISAVVSDLNRVDDAAQERAAELCESLSDGKYLRRTMLTWGEVEKMTTLGFSFGSHTRHHVVLDRVPDDIAREQIFGSQQDLEAHLSASRTRFVALPRGKLGAVDEDELSRFGFAGILTTEPGINRFDHPKFSMYRRDGKYLTLWGRHHPGKLRLELSGVLDVLRMKTTG